MNETDWKSRNLNEPQVPVEENSEWVLAARATNIRDRERRERAIRGAAERWNGELNASERRIAAREAFER